MSPTTRILDSSRCNAQQILALSEEMRKYMPECHPDLVETVKAALQHSQYVFSQSLDTSRLSSIHPFEPLGKALALLNATACKTLNAGSLCFEVLTKRVLPKEGPQIWTDLVHILNWNSTGNASLEKAASRSLAGNDFWYQAIVNARNEVCERVHAGGVPRDFFLQCSGSADNGTITKLPLLSRLCTNVRVQAGAHANATMKPITQSLTAIQRLSSYILPVLPVVTGVAGCWAVSKAIENWQGKTTAHKLCALGYSLFGTAAFISTVKLL